MSGDSREKMAATLDRHELTYELCSDHSMEAARAFGIAYRVPEADLQRWRRLDLEGNSAASSGVLPVPAVFLVGRDGLIHFTYVNPNYRIRCAPEVILAAARAAVTEDH